MALADRYDVILLDLDGVLFRGDVTIAAAPATLSELRARGRRLAFITNNSARTPEEVATKLRGHGLEATADEVVTSALATADVLAERGGGTAFVIGEAGVREALSSAGIAILDGDPPEADWVVVGWDRSVDYAKLRTASMLVQRGARLVATNADASFPAPDGLWPGAGAILASITTTTGVSAEVIGKPQPALFRAALRRSGGGRALVVGDRLETDIAGAVALGWDALLVLSGVTERAGLDASPIRPTYVADDVAGLLDEPRAP